MAFCAKAISALYIAGVGNVQPPAVLGDQARTLPDLKLVTRVLVAGEHRSRRIRLSLNEVGFPKKWVRMVETEDEIFFHA